MTNENSIARSPAELLLELKALVTDAEKMMADSLSGHSATEYDGLRERFDAASACLARACTGARNKVSAGAKGVDNAIRANPYQSLAVAAGLGIVIGGVVATMVARRNA